MERKMLLLKGQNRALEWMATGKKLPEILNLLVQIIESQMEDALCSILLLKENRLYVGAAPTIPQLYNHAIDGVIIGEKVGSCGTAAYRKQTVIVENIGQDPLWEDFREIALSHQLHACWSRPIFSSKGDVLGTFAIYYREVKSPSNHDLEVMDTFSNLAGIAIEHHKKEEQLKASEEKYRIIAENTSDLICIISSDREIEYASPSYQSILGYLPQSVSEIFENIHEDDLPYVKSVLKIAEEKPITMEFRYRHANHHFIWLETSVSPITNYSGEVEKFLFVSREISERKRHEEQLEHMAFYDVLTGLPNRRLFQDRLDLALAHARRYQHSLAVISIDCDKFKQLNDTYGHDAGDKFLQIFADELLSCVRETDTVARMGGDEFNILLPELKSEEYVNEIVERIMRLCEKTWDIHGNEIFMTVSIGVTVYPRDGESAGTLMKNVDLAMYQAKRTSGNDVKYYDEQLMDTVYHRMVMEKDLRRAIENKELTLFYQPQVSLKNGSIVGVEALIRWNHPELGCIPPVKFIKVAEESGFIVPIGEWVLHEACHQLKKWHEMGMSDLYISVNISPKQIQNELFIETVKQALQQADLKPQFLNLELTENIVLHHREELLDQLIALKQLGVRISVDDFGTGYSSFTYLKRFPIDSIKIDRSFIENIPHDGNDLAIVKAIIDMGHTLNMDLVAEGTEHEKQISSLKQQQCDIAQGYYFSKPMDSQELEKHFQGIRQIASSISQQKESGDQP